MSERAIKGLQKEMLSEFEEHLLDLMSPETFNLLRKSVFRSTFQCYRLGLLGLEQDDTGIDKLVAAAIHAVQHEESVLRELEPVLRAEVLEYCLYTWLRAFRIGAKESN